MPFAVYNQGLLIFYEFIHKISKKLSERKFLGERS